MSEISFFHVNANRREREAWQRVSAVASDEMSKVRGRFQRLSKVAKRQSIC